MLKIDAVDVAYGDAQVLFDVSIAIQEGDLTAVIGANGAGKTTLLKTISGILRPQKGTIVFQDQNIDTLAPNKIVAEGIVQVPEGRLLFPDMTIRENLELGAYLTKSKAKINERILTVFELFPIPYDCDARP